MIEFKNLSFSSPATFSICEEISNREKRMELEQYLSECKVFNLEIDKGYASCTIGHTTYVIREDV